MLSPSLRTRRCSSCGSHQVITVEGKEVFTELTELVHPAHTALVLIDMQRDFVAPDGLFGELGVDLSMYAESLPRLAFLLDAARRAAVLVIHVQNTTLPDRMSDSPAQIRFNLRMHAGKRPDEVPLRYSVDGTPGHAFVKELTPGAGEPVVRKYRSSAFWGTNLELLLRSNGIRTVVVGGCTTEGCVESTARDAMFNDLYVVIAADGVASDDREQHEASMLLMRHRFDVATAGEIADVWATASQPDGVAR
jgi:nicotinamidase-related amidase